VRQGPEPAEVQPLTSRRILSMGSREATARVLIGCSDRFENYQPEARNVEYHVTPANGVERVELPPPGRSCSLQRLLQVGASEVKAPKTRLAVGVRQELHSGGMNRHIHRSGRLADRLPSEAGAQDGFEPMDPAIEVRDLYGQPFQADLLHRCQLRPPTGAGATAGSCAGMTRCDRPRMSAIARRIASRS
jgi:hypothetical protein